MDKGKAVDRMNVDMSPDAGISTEQARYNRLLQPSSMFKIFVPTEKKIRLLSSKLLHDYLYLSDEFREPRTIDGMLQLYLSGIASIIYEFPRFGGFIGFVDIVPDYKANISFKLWDRKLWGPTFFRELKDLIELMMDELRLVRLSAKTPDRRMEHMAHLCGFKTECAQRFGFKWDNKYYPLKLLAKTRAIKRGG